MIHIKLSHLKMNREEFRIAERIRYLKNKQKSLWKKYQELDMQINYLEWRRFNEANFKDNFK